MKGLGTALITPFQADGSIDFEALDKLLDSQIAGHTDYLVVLGTTAEAATMTADEKRKVRNHIVNYVKEQCARLGRDKLPLVLGVGGNNTAAVCKELNALAEEYTDMPFAAILSVCPYYNKPSQEGLYQHFCAIVKASPVPVILYNVPGRTGVNLQPATVMRIVETCGDKIMGIKEASGNVEQIKTLIGLRDGATTYFNVISGDDGIACELMWAGADGLISVASNAFPEDFGSIVRELNSGLQERYNKMVGLLFKEGNPSGIKTVLSQKGIISNYLRLPLVANSEAVQEEIRAALNEL